VRYALKLWDALMRYVDNGQLEIDNNAAYAASGIGSVMPRPELCRVGARSGPAELADLWFSE
jgi:Transposase IS66 family